jgi:hypothetical protein
LRTDLEAPRSSRRGAGLRWVGLISVLGASLGVAAAMTGRPIATMFFPASVGQPPVSEPVVELSDRDAGIEVEPLQPEPEPVSDASAAIEVHGRPLVSLLAVVAEDAGRALIVGPKIDGELVSARDRAVDWELRLAAYARVDGFVYDLAAGLIEVRRPRAGEVPGLHSPEDTAAGDAAGEGAGGVAGDVTLPDPAPVLDEKVTEILRLEHADAIAIAAVLTRSAGKDGGRIAADAGANAIVLAGTKAEVARLKAVAMALDRSRRRVLLEARILEVSRSARRELGVEWSLAGDLGAQVSLSPTSTSGDSAALVVATGGQSPFEAKISALESQGRVRVVSRPSVVVLEGSTATIESVRILRIRLPDRGTVVGDDGSVSSAGGGRATEEVPVGVRLEVTPSVRAGSRIHLRIHAKSSSLGPPLPPDGIPEELSRTVEAEIEVMAGTTAVLGGLRREGRSRVRAGVPVLRDIPGLGILFRKDGKESDTEELLVLVTPRLLDDPAHP